MVKLSASAVVLAALVWPTYQHALPYQVDTSNGYKYDDRIDAKRASGMDERQISARFAVSKPRPIPVPGAASDTITLPQAISKTNSLYNRAIHGSAEKFRPLLDSIFRMVGVGSAAEIEQATDTISAKLDAVAAERGWDRLLEREEAPALETDANRDSNADANWESSANFESDVITTETEVLIDPLYAADQVEAKKVVKRETLESEAYQAVAAMLALHQQKQDAAAAAGLEKRGVLCH